MLFLDVWKQQDAAIKMKEANIQLQDTEIKQDKTVWHFKDNKKNDYTVVAYFNNIPTRNTRVYVKQGQIYMAHCQSSKYKQVYVTTDKFKMYIKVDMFKHNEQLYIDFLKIKLLCKDGRMRCYDAPCHLQKYESIAELFANYVVQVG